MDGSSFCTWTQFRKRPFALHLTTQSPPNFFKELQKLFTSSASLGPQHLIDFDQDTGLPIPRPTADLYDHAIRTIQHQPKVDHQPLPLCPQLRLKHNPYYYPTEALSTDQVFPLHGYPWTILPNPITSQLMLGRVFTRDPVNQVLYVQHYTVVTDNIDSYQLKNTKRNIEAKGAPKYAATTDTSAIVKCPGCQHHQIQHIQEALLRASRNYRSPPTCIFKQNIDVAKVLPIKSHQLYKDIILLKHHLVDLLPQYDPTTNQLPFQAPASTGLQDANELLDSQIDSNLDSPPTNPINIELIDRFIEAPLVVQHLKSLVKSLQCYTDLHFYTDGSLQKDPTGIDSMGFGWICANEETLTFSASAILWPSFTKAEMLAVLTVLLTVPANAKVIIYTDSAATINGINSLQQFSQMSVRKREKIPNFPIWMIIAHVKEVLSLSIKMVKVKAHSGDRLNDKADHLAKAAASSTPRINLTYTKLPGLNLVLAYDHLIVEASSRRSIKQLADAQHFHQYLQLQRNVDVLTLTELQHINWKATSFMLNYSVTDNERASTSFSQHRMRTFKYKIFSNELPTLSRLKQRRPDLYTNDTCLFCQRHSESQEHLWTCSGQQDHWQDILNLAATHFMNTLKNQAARRIPMLEAVLHLIHESRTFISKGLVPSYLYQFVQQITRSIARTDAIIAEVYNYTYKQMFTQMWKLRCVKINDYERMMGIFNSDKRSKHRSRSVHYPTYVPGAQASASSGSNTSLPWVAWYAASIRQGLEWLTYAFTPQADMFRSFTTSALSSFTNNHRFNIDDSLINRVDNVAVFFSV